MKKLFVLPILILCTSLSAQDTELLSAGATANLSNDSIGYKLSFGFNRIPGSNPAAGNIFWDKISGSNMWMIDATGEVNIGNAMETSEDNIVFDASLAVNHMVSPRQGIIFDLLRPSVSTSKTRNSGLVYASPGVSYYWVSLSSQKRNMNFTGSYAWDIGNRLQEKSAPAFFTRQKISLGANLNLFKQNFGTGDEFSRIRFSAECNIFSVWGDPVIADGSYANFKCSVSYQPAKWIGVKAGYKIGHQDPMYQKLNVVDFGIVLYR